MQNFWGEQFTFRAHLWFYSKCKFAHTKYAQNIVFPFRLSECDVAEGKDWESGVQVLSVLLATVDRG